MKSFEDRMTIVEKIANMLETEKCTMAESEEILRAVRNSIQSTIVSRGKADKQ